MRYVVWCLGAVCVLAAGEVVYADTGDLTVSQVYCEYAVNPVGIDTAQPRLTWILDARRRGTMQQAYQVLVATSPERLAANTGDLWDTGQVKSDESVNVVYQGGKLSSRQECSWKVRLWDNQGQVSPWSEPATFEVGLLEPTDWHGRWIGLAGPDTAGVSPLLRRAFDAGGPVKRARLYAAGVGWSEYYLNGQRIGENVLDPAATDYDKRILYVTHDVTRLVHPGPNALGVMLGNGFYSEPVALNYGPSPRLLLELVIESADGALQRIVSDGSWRTSSGPVLQNNLFGGEVYDARLEKTGWLEPGYDDSGWAAAARTESPGGRLEAQMIEPIRVNKVLRPVKLTSPKAGVYVYDFGQVFGGWARLRVKGPAGSKIAVRYSTRVFSDDANLPAIIDRDVLAGYATRVVPFPGLVDKRHHQGPDGATDFYTLKGDPAGEHYEPRFTFHPVRYVQLEGLPGEPALEDLEGCVVHSSVDMTGGFQCSNPLLNQINRNCVWTFTNTAFGIELDCLYREHWGWLEPASDPSMLFARRFMPQFWTKFLGDAQCAQHADGVIPDVVPAYPLKGRKTGDPAWAGNYPLVVWYVYQYYSDQRLLERHYPNMKRWVDYLTTLSENHLIEKGGYYGDHMLPGEAPGEEVFISKETPPALLWTGYYHRDAWIVAQAARILGAADDAAAYGQLAEQIRTAMNEKWLDAEKNCYATGSQTANVFALGVGVVPEANRQGVLNSLVEDITVKRQGHLHTGNLGTAVTMDTLGSLGRADVLYRVATATDYPGWGYMVSQGATAIWEAWGGVQDGFIGYNSGEDSMPMFATINEFFYRDLAGIQGPSYFGPRLMAPGFREIEIKPHVVGDLEHASANIKTVRGTVSSGWRIADRIFTLEVSIPVNSMARVSVPLPGPANVTIRESGRVVWEGGAYVPGADAITGANRDGDYVTFNVGSGSYAFAAPIPVTNEAKKNVTPQSSRPSMKQVPATK